MNKYEELLENPRFWKWYRILLPYVIAPLYRLRTRLFPRKRVLFVGQAYYNAWYLSRALRQCRWRADVLNWDQNEASQIYYHGEDFRFEAETKIEDQISFYLDALKKYDVFHFSNKGGIAFGFPLQHFVKKYFPENFEIHLLRMLGKKIVYSNNGCLDGVSQTSFSKWGPESVCAICMWRNHPEVCSDAGNLAWGKFRNEVTDYQCTLGGNRADYNDDPRVHEEPGFYCLDPSFWRPDLEVPERYTLHFSPDTVRLYHAVGNFDTRTDESGVNIKSTHVYLPLIERLKKEGHDVELMHFTGVPNKEIRFYQVQADIFLDMLTFGFFGATAREAMMLGKPVICFLRPEWLESMREQIPEYVNELPIVSATPATVYEVLKELIENPEKRREIGQRSREFAVKWHSAEYGATRFAKIYSKLLRGNRLLLKRH